GEQEQNSNQCIADSDCSGIEGGICQNGGCSCPPDHTLVNDGSNSTCAPILPKVKCTSQVNCTALDGNSICKIRKGVCKCKRGFFVSNDGSKCVSGRIGMRCRRDKDCLDSVRDSECRDNSGEECRLKVVESGPCSRDENCTSKVPKSFCNGNDTIGSTCRCKRGYKEDSESFQCVLNGIGDTCINDSDCQIGLNDSSCEHMKNVGAFCQCKLGFVEKPSSDHAHKGGSGNPRLVCQRRRIEDECVLNNDCDAAIEFSTCKNKVCICMDGYASANNRTYCLKILLQERCQNDRDCSAIEGNAFCEGQICKCPLGYKSHASNAKCVLKVLGDPCQNDTECEAIRDGVCKEGECQCNLDFLSESDTVCRRRLVGEGCSRREHCGEGAHCAHEVCRCKLGDMTHIRTPHKCEPMKLDNVCTSDNQCDAAVNNSECTNEQRCGCKRGYKEWESRCTKLKINFNCNTSTSKLDDECRAAVNNSACTATVGEGIRWTCKCDARLFCF
ncbi:hypothetical protein EGW08_005322, partial [Elysia chlorotica]